MVEVRVLGTVEVLGDDRAPVPVGGPRPTRLLVALALAGGSVVSADRLVGEVWGASAPPSAHATLQSYVSRLRRVLEPDRSAHGAARSLVRGSAGYRLDPGVVAVDGHRFEAAVTRAREASARGELAAVAAVLGEALQQWRGPVAQGVELGSGSRAEATRLEQLRLTATEERATAMLALGEHERLVGELDPIAAAHPIRERLHALRMLALYRSGRQADALAAYRQLRDQLVDALGVEPGPRVLQLHERILEQDPTLDPGDGPLPPGGRGPGGPGGRDPGVPSVPGPGAVLLGNLPAPLVELVGLRSQRERLAVELGRSRLITLTGAGGCGKTQLALQVARDTRARFPDGSWVVELASRRDPEAVPVAVAEVLGVDDAPLPGLLDDLALRLRGRRSLLLLDNCEHLVDGCAWLVRELLQRCPDLQVITTSRQTLDLDGEVVWRVPSLSLPPVGAGLRQLAASDAAQLFLARAEVVRPGFAPTEGDAFAIAAICRELDGIPLAIELAASRLRVLSPQEIAERLDDRFAVLRSSRRGAPPRHRTLDAAIAWSYELLDPAATRLFLRLAVFESGFQVAAAEAVCSDEQLPVDRVLELLDDLVGGSLVVTLPGAVGPARHDLLQSIRSFARARWSDVEREAVAGRHAAWFARVGDAAGSELTGHDQVRWLNRLHAEQADVRAALGWSLDHDRVDLAVRIVGGMWWFWLQFGHAREGAVWLDRVLDAVATPVRAVDAEAMARTSYAAGRLAGATGDLDRGRRRLESAVAHAAAAGADGWLALSQARLAQHLRAAGDPAGALGRLREAEALAQRSEQPWVVAGVSDVLGHLAVAGGDLDGAARAFRASEQGYLEAEDRWSACLARLGRARVARRAGDPGGALVLHGENLRATRELTRSAFDFVGLARDLRGVAGVASGLGHHGLAARLCGASETLRTPGEVALTSDERVEVEDLLAAATAAIGADAVRREQSAGGLLGASEALALALAATEDLADVASEVGGP